MNLVEQAVFTSAQTSRAAGYQLAATSPGISEEDCRALSTWGPSHDSLLKSGRQASSVNFHPLPSGHYCVSRTSAAGNEYSGRGVRVYTQCLVVSPETLGQFANNPFSVVRAASGSGLMKQYEKVPDTLEPVPLVGRAPALDPTLLSRARRHFGAEPIASLVQAALHCETMAIVGTSSGELAVAALLNCLPASMRLQFSFSTGLRTSARRPFRLVALDNDSEERRRAKQNADLALVDFASDSKSGFAPSDDWPRAILSILQSGRTTPLGRCFAAPSSQLSLDQLNAMGRKLLEELPENGAEANPATPSEERSTKPPAREPQADDQPAARAASSGGQSERQQAHAAHRRFQSDGPASAEPENRPSRPAAKIAAEDPHVVATLETLDDVVFGAIKGNADSLAELQQMWPRLRAELGGDVLAQSREQYLRYALHTWEQCVSDEGVRPTDRAVNALEVLCLLFDEH